MPNAATRRARDLRNYLNALSKDLATCQTAAEVRCLKQAVRAAELELTALAVAS